MSTDNTLVPSMNWAQNNKHSLHQVFNCSLAEPELEAMHLSLIETSFFLPPEVLANKQFVISPLMVLDQKSFAEFIEYMNTTVPDTQWEMKCDVHYFLLAHAKNIGISIRWDMKTQKIYIVCKLWYGVNPMKDLGADDTKYQRKVQKLYHFINCPPATTLTGN